MITSFSNLHRRAWLRTVVGSVGVCSLPFAALAQGWPGRPVRFVVPYAAGNQADIVARLLAEELSKKWSQPVVVDNQAGAGGAIGVAQVARAAPDGYTIGFAAIAALAITPHIQKAPYDPLVDITPLIGVTEVRGNAWAVHPALPARNVQELVALARSRPQGLTYATPGSGTIPHLNMEILARALQIKLIHIPYKAAVAGVADVVAGQVDMVYDALNLLKPQIDAGKLRAIAVNGSVRNPLLPDVPSFGEQGVRADTRNAWQMVIAPRNVPREIASRISADVAELLGRSDFTARLPSGSDPLNLSMGPAIERVRTEHALFGGMVKQLGIQAS